MPQVWPTLCECAPRRRPKPGDKWHLDEVFLTIQGKRHYLWRAIDQDGSILDIVDNALRSQMEVIPQITPSKNCDRTSYTPPDSTASTRPAAHDGRPWP